MTDTITGTGATGSPAAVVTPPGPPVRMTHRTREDRSAGAKVARASVSRESQGRHLVDGRAGLGLTSGERCRT